MLAIYDRKMNPSLKKLRVFVSEAIQSALFLRSLKTNVQLFNLLFSLLTQTGFHSFL